MKPSPKQIRAKAAEHGITIETVKPYMFAVRFAGNPREYVYRGIGLSRVAVRLGLFTNQDFGFTS